jgi:Ni/Co efflux regulator RcnB
MARILRCLVAFFAIVSLAAIDSPLAQTKDHKEKDRKEQSVAKGKKDAKDQKVKQHKHQNGKDLVGDKIKVDGKHKFHENGKNTAYVDVSKGKIAGVTVKHAEKGDVPVTKYKTTKKMARGPTSGIQLASLVLAQDQYIGTLWIGYGYIDDYGDEVIYWFPYDMILDGDTGAIEYYPAE